jgi:hypothetical protein
MAWVRVQISKFLSFLCYLMALPTSRLNVLNDRIINECGEVSGMRIGRGFEALGINLTQCHFAHYESHMT